MKVYISHAKKDEVLASQLARQLTEAGADVFEPFEEIAPGDNWAKKIGQALYESDLMVFLFTPDSFKSDILRNDLEFALFSEKFRDRVYSVYVGPSAQMGADIPWILRKYPHRQVESLQNGEGDVANEILALNAVS